MNYEPDDRDDRLYELRQDEACYAHVATGTYANESLEVTFQGITRPSDYGVPGSSFTEIEDIEITQVLIFGIEVDPKILPKELTDAFMSELSGEVDFT